MSPRSSAAGDAEAAPASRERRTTISCTMMLTPPPPPDDESQIERSEEHCVAIEKPPQQGRLEVVSTAHTARPFRPAWLGVGALGSRIVALLFGQREDTRGEPSDKDRSTLGDGQSGFSAAPWDDKDTASACTGDGREEGRQLMSVFQIPAYMVEAHIWGSYRPLCFSVQECLWSWLYVHSELGNIMTHLGGLLIFVALALVTGPVVVPWAAGERASRVGAVEHVVLYTYIGAVVACLAASVAFHTLACHSRRRHLQSLRCDFIGILVLIVGSFVPIGYYGFQHSPRILIGYTVAFVAIGIAGIVMSALGHVEEPRRARWRPVIFIGISGAGLVPTIHAAVLNGYADAVDRMSLWYVLGMCALYFVGTVAYAFKLPERFRPGKHDVLLHSHQVFHIFVVLAALLHYVGIVRALSWAHAADPG
ncbi:Adiponectin receptor protein 2 [Coemansia biformis]|uniref:Adiponectin receptor protein 2 n=1 Tax=Coemansia biformis TaxID=1286918 RepID=A0A9W7YHV7_9FUNG|nr:Adiponectin receptor protein 2 [Coemansia biformis]